MNLRAAKRPLAFLFFCLLLCDVVFNGTKNCLKTSAAMPVAVITIAIVALNNTRLFGRH
jgi:hypothetical protein